MIAAAAVLAEGEILITLIGYGNFQLDEFSEAIMVLEKIQMNLNSFGRAGVFPRKCNPVGLKLFGDFGERNLVRV